MEGGAPIPSARYETETAQRTVPNNRIVILGGGFGGMSAAESLEDLFGADQSVEFTLVSETNALLFTPMLAEVAGSSLEPTHISSPLRTSLHRTRVIRGRVSQVSLENRRVTILLGAGAATETLSYDHLILALGSVSNYLGLENGGRRVQVFREPRSGVESAIFVTNRCGIPIKVSSLESALAIRQSRLERSVPSAPRLFPW